MIYSKDLTKMGRVSGAILSFNPFYALFKIIVITPIIKKWSYYMIFYFIILFLSPFAYLIAVFGSIFVAWIGIFHFMVVVVTSAIAGGIVEHNLTNSSLDYTNEERFKLAQFSTACFSKIPLFRIISLFINISFVVKNNFKFIYLYVANIILAISCFLFYIYVIYSDSAFDSKTFYGIERIIFSIILVGYIINVIILSIKSSKEFKRYIFESYQNTVSDSNYYENSSENYYQENDYYKD